MPNIESYSDGTWARASDKAWYYSHLFDFNQAGKSGECFWLDHRGYLNHTLDREQEYIHKNIDRLGVKGVKGHSAGVAKKNFPAWLWAEDTGQDQGLPVGDDLTEGMKRGGVDKNRVPIGVKVFLPALKVSSYMHPENVTLQNFTENPAKINWIMDNMDQGKEHPALPIMVLHPLPAPLPRLVLHII